VSGFANLFNADQREHMAYLSRQDPATLCWCGWYTLAEIGRRKDGRCPSGGPSCPPGKTLADKNRLRCPECGNAPWKPGGELTHLVSCSKSPSYEWHLERVKRWEAKQQEAS
jgi:hypothetical protein